jgi:thioredoxin reductase
MCKTGPKGHLVVDEYGRTSITGVYGAGDQASQLHQAATAAASGLTAGIGINLYLSQLDRTREQ